MVFEAISGSIIQSYAFLTGSNHSTAVIFSLVISIFTAAFTSTCVSFDSDVDKQDRFRSPKFYGYIPRGKKKAQVFMSMFLISASQLTAKAFACALCAVESSTTLIFYLLGDMALY